MNIVHLSRDDPRYPASLKIHLVDETPDLVAALGNIDILKQKKLAFFCSVNCPGHLILKTYDLAQRLKEASITVIGGFHSPIERECLRILLRGTQPIIVCPPRSIQGIRMRAEYKKPIEKGRLLLLSHFKESQKRNTVETANERNRFVAALSNLVLVAYAAPNSKTEQFCKEMLSWRKSLYTLESDANANLIKLGARPIQLEKLVTKLKENGRE